MPRPTTRSKFTNGEKVSILAIQALGGVSNAQIAQEYGCSEGTIRYWWKNIDKLREAKMRNISTHQGPPRANTELEARVMEQLDGLMFYGVPSNQQDIIRLALAIDPDFKHNNRDRLAKWASRFLLKEKIVLRRVTQHGHRLPADIIEEQHRFLSAFNNLCRLSGREERHILNLDQTGIFYENPRNITLAHRGATQVPISADKLSMRASAIFTVTMDGQKLRPYLVFKGRRSPRSRISREFASLPSSISYSVQSKAWIDTEEMLRYIETILIPFTQTQPEHRCLLLLDSFSVHLCERVQTKMRDLNIDLLYVPKGMTGLLQPLDIGINKPFKDRLKTCYTQWLVSQITDAGPPQRRPKPSRSHVAHWVQTAWATIPTEVIINAFSILRNVSETPQFLPEHGLQTLADAVGTFAPTSMDVNISVQV